MAIGDQHIVSRLVLKRWADADGLLIAHRVDNGHIRRSGPGGLGRLDSFVQPDLSHPLERTWWEIENRAGDAIRSVCESSEAPVGDAAAALKDLLALHLLRSRDTTERWADSLRSNERVRSLLEWLDEPGVLDNLVVARTGLHAAGPEMLAAEKAHQLAQLEQRLGMGGLGFVEATLENLERARTRFQQYSVEIGRTDSTGPLIIGDTPAIPIDTDRGLVGFRKGTTLDTSNQIIMPIDPHHVLSLGPEPARFDVPADAAATLNHLQMLNSRVVVMYGTESGLGGWVDDWREVHVHPDVLREARAAGEGPHG